MSSSLQYEPLFTALALEMDITQFVKVLNYGHSPTPAQLLRLPEQQINYFTFGKKEGRQFIALRGEDWEGAPWCAIYSGSPLDIQKLKLRWGMDESLPISPFGFSPSSDFSHELEEEQ